MYEDSYELTSLERDSYQEIRMELDRLGYFRDPKTDKPRDWGVVRGGRFLVDAKKRVWSLTLEGSYKDPNDPKSGKRRNSVVEMWTGNWRRVKCDDGKFRYAKQIVNVPIDKRVGRRASVDQITWFETQCGYKHPHDKPDRPTVEQIAELEGRRLEDQRAIFARLDQETGLDTEAIKAAVLKDEQPAEVEKEPGPARAPKRTNKRKRESASVA